MPMKLGRGNGAQDSNRDRRLVALLAARGRRRLRLRQLAEGQDRRRRDDRRRRRRRHERRGSQAGGEPRAARAAAALAARRLRRRELEASGQEPQGPRRPRRGGRRGASPTVATAACRAAWSATSPAASVDKQIAADVTYSQPAVNRFVRKVADEVDREAQDATVEPTADSLEVVPAKNGRKLRDNLLTRELKAAVLNADADHTIAARTHYDQAGGDHGGSRRRVPDLPHPRPRQLHAAPLEGPEAGQDLHGRGRPGRPGNPGRALRRSRKRRKTRPGTCPNPTGPAASPGSRSRRGLRTRSRPAGWGSTKAPASTAPKRPTRSARAASHGCVRMAIPDVEELYDQVEVGTPIYIG